jgi:hypothetical protein
MSDSSPALVRRLAVKVAAAFQDVENELAAGEASSATARPGRPRAQFAYGKVLILRGAGFFAGKSRVSWVPAERR